MTKISIIGGCGHVGLPLGVKFALAGAETSLVDINQDSVNQVNSGSFPFVERGGDAELKQALKMGLKATTNAAVVADSDVIVFVTGTPVDEHLNPKLSGVLQIFDHYEKHFRPGALVIMRSTLFPGTMEHLHQRLKQRGVNVKLAFCPERVAQGVALEEIDSLPQIVSAFDDQSFEAAYQLFASLAPSIIRLTPIEAEMAKLMANSWRYLEFAIANQFYMIAEENGVDFNRVFQAIRHDYPRAKGYKSPGFAAGPCLFKDTMQLAAFHNHQFYLGHSAMLVNEGLADLAVEKARVAVGGNLWGKTVGLLGMTFKADNDDIRESLSFRVKKAAEFHGAEIAFHDPYISGGVSLDELRKCAEVLILCTPHSEYRGFKARQPLVDVWGFFPTEKIEVLPGKMSGAKKAANF